MEKQSRPGRLRRRVALTTLGVLILLGCSVLCSYPDDRSQAERDHSFPTSELPLEQDVTVYWDKHGIPFVDAATDSDAAFTLGLVHAHLRLGQMEFMRRISAGRLSEMAGPFTREIDVLLRTVDLGKSAEQVEANLPPETRLWLTRFVAGVNWVLTESDVSPPEFGILGLDREPWSVRDVLRIGRLASADLSWMYYAQALELERKTGGSRLRDQLLKLTDQSLPSFESQTDGMSQLLGAQSKSGSNSLVISKGRSTTGAPIMANDPHLGIFAPNFWLIVGYRSPSYHVVGLTIPGLPFVAVGRNAKLAWGGTNMRAISSHLHRVDPAQKITSREEEIGTRFWFNTKATIRDSAFGPIVSDLESFPAPEGKPKESIALNWVGHQPTDEISVFLAANRATTWQTFIKAFENYGVGAQNILFADVEGNIGQVLAHRQPLLRFPEKTRDTIKDPGNPVVGYKGPLELPVALNPQQGYIASANNLPVVTDPPLAFGYANNSRMERMNRLMAETPRVSVADIQRWQLDVLSLPSQRIQSAIVGHVAACGSVFNPDALPEAERTLWQTFAGWDARYARDSRGPVAFETLLHHAVDPLLQKEWPEADLRAFIKDGDYWKSFTLKALLAEKDSVRVCRIVAEALTHSLDAFERFQTWGEMHQLSFGPPLERAPLIGSRFHLRNIPSDGSSDTLMKAAHKFSGDKVAVSYGACARHISNLADPNENYFVLLGGQDGWLNSPNLDDQVELWQAGEYVRVPLELGAVQKWATSRTVLTGAH